jgi:toxin ParE1/3/4
MTKIRIAAEVWADAFLAVDWYESRVAGLGADFMQAVYDVLERIKDNPLQFPVVEGGVRRARTKRFPYGVFFSMEDGLAVVLGIENLQRVNVKWKKRKKK